MVGPSEVSPSACQVQFDAFIIYPSRDKYPQTAEGEAAYDKAIDDYQKSAATIGECLSKNTSCGYSEGMYDSLMLQYSNLSSTFRALKSRATSEGGKLTVSELDSLEKLCKASFWKAIFKCRRDIADNLRRSIVGKDGAELAALMVSINEGKPSPENEEIVQKFGHVAGDDRKILILLVEAAGVDEDALIPFFPKPVAPALAK